ncbi:Ycf48-like protein [compost metagenome]
MREGFLAGCFDLNRIRCAVMGGIVFGGLSVAAAPALAFEPPLEVPAMRSDRLVGSPMLAVTSAGSRLVAVGLRGGILISDDQGKTWMQASVPVSVDLVAVTFPSASQGWAVGHGGVVLHSHDAGLTWEKQLDGLMASKLAIDFYTSNQDHLDGAAELLTKEQNLAVDKETQPFLDVFFTDDLHGYVVGTFNRIFATEDGGLHWKPLMHLTDNPTERHFYAIAGAGNQLFISGEQGKVWRHDLQTNRFVSIDTPYNGTLFGVVPAAHDQLYVYGMRGSFFRSSDQGLTWERVSLPVDSNLVRVMPYGQDRLLAIAQSGEVLVSSDGARSFKPLPQSSPIPSFGATLLDEKLMALVGPLGVRVEGL